MSNTATRFMARAGGKITESLGGGGVQELLAQPHAEVAPAATGSMAGRGRDRAAGTLDITLVTPDPDQPRKEFTEEAIDRLAKSLKDRGQLQNVRVRWSAPLQKWVLISGERRYRAALRAGLKTLKCEFVEKELTEAEKLEDALVENCLREDLNSVELAQSYEKLMRLRGWSAKELAESLSVNQGVVSKTLAVLKLPEDLQAKVADGTMARITAYEISRLDGEAEQRAMASRAEAEGLNNAQIAGAVQETKGRRKHAVTKTGRRLSCTLAGGENVTVAAKGELTLDGLIEVLGEVLRAAKKAKATGDLLEAIPEILKAKPVRKAV